MAIMRHTLKSKVHEGMQTRYDTTYLPDDQREAESTEIVRELSERLDYEVGVISKTGFNDYLIVADFMRWARDQKFLLVLVVDRGRLSKVAYLLGITDIDPSRFGLLLKGFLTREGITPDFDIDFCMRRRGEVIDYVRDKYGRDCVANIIITFGTFGAKNGDAGCVARVRDLPYAEADKLAKMVPDDLNISLEDAIEKSPEFKRV